MASWLSKALRLGDPFAKNGEWIMVRSPSAPGGLLMKRATASGYETREPTQQEINEFAAEDTW